MTELIAFPKKYFVYNVAFLDPAGGKERKEKNKARSAIVVVSGDAANRFFVRYAWADRCATNRMIEKVWEVNKLFRLDLFGVEANAQQGLFADMLITEADRLGLSCPISKITHSTTLEKDFRIRSILQKPAKEGRLFLCEDDPGMEELQREILNFPMSSTKDMIDALASAVDLIPSQETFRHVRHDEQQRLRYLRESGAPASYIQQEHAKMTRQSHNPRSLQEFVAMIRGEN